MTWRVFTGLRGDFAWVDRRGLTWEQARVVLRDDLWKGYAGSHECEDCISQFTEAIAALDAAAPGRPVELTEVDGHDYLLLQDA